MVSYMFRVEATFKPGYKNKVAEALLEQGKSDITVYECEKPHPEGERLNFRPYVRLEVLAVEDEVDGIVEMIKGNVPRSDENLLEITVSESIRKEEIKNQKR